MIRVVVADDQELVRDGIALMLEAAGTVQVVGVAADGAEAVALALRLVPDVVLMDVRMPDVDGLAATRTILAERPGIRVVMLTTYDIDDYVAEALTAGAVGYLLKDTPRTAMVAAVVAAAAGDVLLDPGIARRLVSGGLQKMPTELARKAARLTSRELDVLSAVADGLSNAEIAGRLVLSEATVKTHVARLLDKLQVRDRVQLAVLAHRYPSCTRPAVPPTRS